MNYFKCSDYPFDKVKEFWKATGKPGCHYESCKALHPSCPEALDAVIMILE